MVKRERTYLPMGFGGLVRYSERERELVKLKPQHVIWGIIILVIIEVFLKLFF
ncbi:MAG: preprotein translocase subunit Sec61beta [Candidatus Aenigmarchaeota archaeon]|nr:preprotein translocase subunit Sec61beta [Candidatus Aenigmarchaeota archaeon]